MVSPAHVQALRRSQVLASLPDPEIDALAAQMREKRYKRNEVVFHAGDPAETLHVVIDGRLKVTVAADDGDETVLAIIGPGEIFGEIALLDGGPRSATVRALEPVTTAALARRDLLASLRRSPEAAEALLAALARMVRRLTDDLAVITGHDLAGRLARKLIELADAHGEEVDGAVEITAPVTQDEIAGMIGATRASVNKLLGEYEAQGVIVRRGRRIAVVKGDTLRRKASL